MTLMSPIEPTMEAWRRDVATNFGVDAIPKRRDGFRAGLTVFHAGGIRLARAEAPAAIVRRVVPKGCGSQDRRILVHLQMQGEVTLSQFGRLARLSPGDLCLADSAFPYEFDLEERGQLLCLSIPERHAAGRLVDPQALCGRQICGDQPLSRLVGACLMTLWTEVSSQLDTIVPERAAWAVLDLLSALEAPANAGASEAEQLYRSALDLIEQHKTDTDFTVSRLAQALGTSMRRLQRAFAARDDTPRRRLNEERLRAAAARLADGRYARTSITRIAFDAGFNDLTHFERCFSRIYGCTPSAYRAESSLMLSRSAERVSRKAETITP